MGVNYPFIHQVDKSSIPTCNILGVEIAAIDMEWLLDFIDKNIEKLSGDYMCVANVHTTIMSFEDENYCAIQNNGIMAIPDGGPLSCVGIKRGYKHMRRTTGPDLMEEIFKASTQKGYRHFFYGSTKEVLEKLSKELAERYPGIQIGGTYSPPFHPMKNEEKENIIKKINNSKSDFIWVGLGAPKQEKWMAEHQGKLSGFMIGVGAGFDYCAGCIKRAPEWMKKRNLEWLFRLIQEPQRLFKRYWHANTRFIWYVYIRGK